MVTPYRIFKTDPSQYVDVFPLETDGGTVVPREILLAQKFNFDSFVTVPDTIFRLPATYGDRTTDFRIGTYFYVVGSDLGGLDGLWVVKSPGPTFNLTQTLIPVDPVGFIPAFSGFAPYGTSSWVKISGDMRYRFGVPNLLDPPALRKVDTFNLFGSAGATSGIANIPFSNVAWTGQPIAARGDLPTNLSPGVIYSIQFSVDGAPAQTLNVLGENAPTFNALMVQLNSQLIGATIAISTNNVPTTNGLVITSKSIGVSSVIFGVTDIGPNGLMAALGLTYTTGLVNYVNGVAGVNDGTYTIAGDSYLSIFDAERNQAVTVLPLQQALTQIPASIQIAVPYGFVTYSAPVSTTTMLPGRGAVNFGYSYDTDVVKLLENFASPLSQWQNPPLYYTGPTPATKGQLWFNVGGGAPSNLTTSQPDRVFVCTDDTNPLDPEWAEVLLVGASSPYLLKEGDIVDPFGAGSGRLLYTTPLGAGNPIIDNNPNVLVTKQYVDSFAIGITWRRPIKDPDLNGITAVEPGAPPSGAGYIVTASGVWTGAVAVAAGDYVYWDGSVWTVVENNITAGYRFGVAWEHGTADASLTGIGIQQYDLVQYIGTGATYNTAADWYFPEGRANGYGSATPISINTGTQTFTFAGDVTASFISGNTFDYIGDSVSGDGVYSILTSTFGGVNTDVVVLETIPGAPASDGIAYPEIKDGITVVVSDPDSAHYGHTYMYSKDNDEWIEISNPGNVTAGLGLYYTFGNTLNVGVDNIGPTPLVEVPNTTYINSSNQVAVNMDTMDANYLQVDGGNFAPAPVLGETLMWDGAQWSPSSTNAVTVSQIYDLSGASVGTASPSEIVFNFVATRQFSIPANFAGSIVRSQVAATGSTQFDIQVNNITVNTITFAPTSSSGTFGASSALTINAGDIITIVAPVAPDGTLADISYSILGNTTDILGVFDIPVGVPGTPTASLIVMNYVAIRNFTISGTTSDHQAAAQTAATASTTFDIRKNGVSFGDVTFPAGGPIPSPGTFTITNPAALTIIPGDIITIVAPLVPDATLADIAITLKAIYT